MKVFSADERAFLEKPWIGRLATTSPDGFPHVVPLWYMIDGDDVIITAERRTVKVGNLALDNRAALNVGGEPEQGPAYLIRGRVATSDDPDQVWLKKITHHYEDEEQAARDLAEWVTLDMVLLRMTVERVTKVY